MNRLVIILLLFSMKYDVQSQVTGSYNWGTARLTLQPDSSYAYYKGACIAYYGEFGKYLISEDTVFFFRKDSCCIYCLDVDSNAYHLNENNLFTIETYRVKKCKKGWDKDDELAQILFFGGGILYTHKSPKKPHFNKENSAFAKRPAITIDYKKLESDAIMKLLFREAGY